MHMYQNQPQYNSGYYIPPQNSYMRTPLPQTPVMLKGRPVSSIEEVKASAIDFDGSVFYFPDVANKRIYTKQIGMDGSAIFNIYELKEQPFFQEIPQDFVTRQEFEDALNSLRQTFTSSSSVPATTEKPAIDF